nr:uveal autoantigen with coiled-coil domains and ankyrin repeats [Ipomoea batatas]
MVSLEVEIRWMRSLTNAQNQEPKRLSVETVPFMGVEGHTLTWAFYTNFDAMLYAGGKEPEVAKLQRELEQKLAKINEMKRERDELKARLEKQKLPRQEAAAAFKRLVEDFNAMSNKYNSMLHESSLAGKGRDELT